MARGFAVWLVVAGLAVTGLPAAHAGGVNVETTGVTVGLDVESVRERRYRGIMEQKYDYSCGAAALASLLKYHYGRSETTELDVFKGMWRGGDKEKIREKGFSMLDMKRYLSQRSIKANGYKVSLDKLVEAGIPGIALINTDGYKHFVLIKGVREDAVLYGDPARGRRKVDRERFEEMWNGAVFVVLEDNPEAKATFGEEQEWTVRMPAPIRTGVEQSRNAFTSTGPVVRPGPNAF